MNFDLSSFWFSVNRQKFHRFWFSGKLLSLFKIQVPFSFYQRPAEFQTLRRLLVLKEPLGGPIGHSFDGVTVVIEVSSIQCDRVLKYPSLVIKYPFINSSSVESGTFAFKSCHWINIDVSFSVPRDGGTFEFLEPNSVIYKGIFHWQGRS